MRPRLLEQLAIPFDAPLPPPASPPKRVQSTSREAFRDALEAAPGIEADVLAALRARGPLTCTELAEATHRVIDNVRPAVTHLKDVGLVAKTDARRPTRYGKASIVWRAT